MTILRRIGTLVGERRAAERANPDTRGIEARLEHLEALVEGLQDAVHRDAIRHEQRMSELERKTEPEALAKALSEDARRRGL